MLDSGRVGQAKKSAGDEERSDSPLRRERIRKGLTRAQLAERANLHPNSIKNIENGTTREVTPGNAAAIAKVLKSSVEELGLRVRTKIAPSVRMRQLTPDQRQLVHDILSLPDEQYAALRAALERIRARKGKKA